MVGEICILMSGGLPHSCLLLISLGGGGGSVPGGAAPRAAPGKLASSKEVLRLLRQPLCEVFRPFAHGFETFWVSMVRRKSS
jgi:hypothetical protein